MKSLAFMMMINTTAKTTTGKPHGRAWRCSSWEVTWDKLVQ